MVEDSTTGEILQKGKLQFNLNIFNSLACSVHGFKGTGLQRHMPKFYESKVEKFSLCF